MAAQIHLLSPAAHERLRLEHEDLTTRGRIDIAQIIERARELGDLKENGDYHAAKDFQGMMEDRIRRLEGILENCEISDAVDDGTVGISSKVTIVFDGDSDDMAETYLVDSVEERRDGVEVVTPASPLGAALMGAKEGATVSYAAPNGSDIRARVLKVELS
jgi:transcription elongation factor GreA